MHPYTQVANYIKNNECFLRQDALIVFVCGRDIKDENSRRKIFFDYAKKHIPGFHFLLAEDIFSVKSEHETDLLTVEKNLANYSDCIIVILESESAFTELGAFAVSDRLCSKIIPINDKKYINKQTFINLGPISKIDSFIGGLGPTVHADMEAFAHCFDDIQKKLENISAKRSTRLEFLNYNEFIDRNKERMLLVYDIINLLAPILKQEILFILEKIYGKKRYDVIHYDIRLLTALGLIKHHNKNYYPSNPTLRFIKFTNKIYFNIKSDVILYYKKNIPNKLNILEEITCNA